MPDDAILEMPKPRKRRPVSPPLLVGGNAAECANSVAAVLDYSSVLTRDEIDGREAGRRWACEKAHYRQVRRIAFLRGFVQGVAEIFEAI